MHSIACRVQAGGVRTEVVARLAVVLVLILICQVLQLSSVSLARLPLALEVSVAYPVQRCGSICYFLFALLVRYYDVVLFGVTAGLYVIETGDRSRIYLLVHSFSLQELVYEDVAASTYHVWSSRLGVRAHVLRTITILE